MNPQSPNPATVPPVNPARPAPQVNDISAPGVIPPMPPLPQVPAPSEVTPLRQPTPMAGNDIARPTAQPTLRPRVVQPIAPQATTQLTTPLPMPPPTIAAGSLEPMPLPPSPTARPVSFQPTTPTRPMAAQIERIDETPQRNSKDIESLIAKQHRLKRLKSFGSLLIFVAGVALAAFVINNFVFQSYYVDGTSMTPTLHNDDRLIIDKVEHTWASIQGKPYIPVRGQIIVLDSSIVGVGGHPEQLIKRVIGLPGDTIIIKDGIVTIKNAANPDGFDVNKQLGLNLEPTFSAGTIQVTIPDGQVYVMGDNRVENGSYDSRAFGPIPASKIVGRLWARILPVDKAQVF